MIFSVPAGEHDMVGACLNIITLIITIFEANFMQNEATNEAYILHTMLNTNQYFENTKYWPSRRDPAWRGLMSSCFSVEVYHAIFVLHLTLAGNMENRKSLTAWIQFIVELYFLSMQFPISISDNIENKRMIVAIKCKNTCLIAKITILKFIGIKWSTKSENVYIRIWKLSGHHCNWNNTIEDCLKKCQLISKYSDNSPNKLFLFVWERKSEMIPVTLDWSFLVW